MQKRLQKQTQTLKLKTAIKLITIFMAMILSACGNEASTETQERAFGIDYSEELVVQKPEQVICGQESAWVITTVKDDYIYKLAYNTEVARMEKIEWQVEEGKYSILNIAEQNGALYVEFYNNKEDTFVIRKYGADGSWSDVMSIKIEEGGSHTIVGSGFFVDSSENVYLVSENTVMRFDGEGKQTYKYNLRGDICFFQENSEGDVKCLTVNKNEITLFEFLENQTEEKWTLKVSAKQVHSITSSEEGVLCLTTDEEILFLESESGRLVARTDLVKLGVVSVVAGYYDTVEGALHLYGSVRNGTKSLRYSLLSHRDGFMEQRTELIYGMVGETNHDASSNIWAAITTFNQENEDYYVTIKNYDGWFNIERLHADMAAGDGPDIIDMIYSNYYESYAKNGYLEDLSPYLEESKYKDDIIWNVLDTYKIDGKLYLFAPKFRLEGLLIHPEYEAFVEEWNMETFLELIEKNNWDKDIFGVGRGDPDMLLYYMMCGRQEDFIDWEKKVAAFETEEFMDMLVLCKEYAEVDWTDTMEWTYGEYKWNTLCKSTIFGVAGSGFIYLGDVDTYGREYQIYGYPTLSGQSYGITACGDSCAIYAGSKQKEGAWEFIESLLWESNQKHQDLVNGGFPIRSSVLREKATEAESTIVRSGDEFLTMTESETSIIMDIIYNGELSRVRVNQTIMSIIQEETAPYFAGDKSAQEVAHIIQSRVQLMLGE